MTAPITIWIIFFLLTFTGIHYTRGYGYSQFALVAGKHTQNHDGINHTALLSDPIVWWRKPCEGLDGHGISPKGRCEGSPEPSEVSSPGKLRVFSKSPIGSIETSFITVLEMLSTCRKLGGFRIFLCSQSHSLPG